MDHAALSSCPDEIASLLEWVDSVADRFENAWKQGESPCIAAFVAGESGERRRLVLLELAKIDLERRRKRGEARSWQDYLQAFPELAEEQDNASTPVLNEVNRQRASPGCNDPSFLPPVRLLSQRSFEAPVIQGFEILSELGHGGMGTVYKARQERLKRLVALKVLQRVHEVDPRRRLRFRLEAEATARLQHPNIAQVHEIGAQDGLLYLVMEYVEGGSLGDWLRGKAQPARQSAELIATLARAMHYAHEHGVVHRDLKPDNILLHLPPAAREGKARKGIVPFLAAGVYTAKITDSGLAKLLEADSGLSLSGSVVGTPSYMAPEQAEGKSHAVGPAADIYALGAILYEMLTGRPPFAGNSLLDILEQVRKHEPVSPAQLVPRVPRDLENICLKALAHTPAGRYPSAGALAEDLERFLRGEPIRARPVSRGERLIRWCRRRPAQAGMILMALLVILTVVTSSILLAVSSTARIHGQRRAAQLQQLQLLRASDHLDGWSDQAWSLIAAAVKLRDDVELRSLAADAAQVWMRARAGPANGSVPRGLSSTNGASGSFWEARMMAGAARWKVLACGISRRIP